jgi:DNA-binding Lrp family transcriptional regulator
VEKEKPEIPGRLLRLSPEELQKRIDRVEEAILTNRGVGLAYPELEERLNKIREVYICAKEEIERRTQAEDRNAL